MGRDGEALTYAEKARARELLDLLADRSDPSSPNPPTFQPLTAAQLRSRISPGTVLVEFTVLDDQLLTWVLRHEEDPKLLTSPLRRAELDELVGRIQLQAKGRNPDLDPEALHRLHRILVAPVLGLARSGEKLVFVPDDSIHGVPFAALRDSASNRFLIEDHPIAIAPSASLYAFAERRDREMPRGETPAVLLVGNPDFSPQVHPGLAPVEGAELEAREVAELYPGSRLLQGPAATREAFLELLPERDVVHFAGHAISDPYDPTGSQLVLASSGDGWAGGVLYATELLESNLPRTRLFVLSACSTAGGHAIGPEGVSSLVRPILGAGVPAVVGSIWDVSDLASRRLLIEFHRRFSAGAEAATALQEAQRQLLEGENRALGSVFSWAPFQVIGTTTLTGSNYKEE